MYAILPGLILALGVAVAAHLLSHLPVWPFTLAGGEHPIGASSLAILLGIVIANLGLPSARLKAGVGFCIKKILPVGIVLLGARLAFGDLLELGITGLLLSLLTIATCAAVMLGLARLLHLPGRLAILVGIGTAICGGSAIAAAAPVIQAEEEDVAWSVAAVAFLGLVAMFALPPLGMLFGLRAESFGMWAGLTIQQTPQVVAAGLLYGGEASEVATLVKLVRVTLLAPVVFCLGLAYSAWSRRQTTGSEVLGPRQRLLPAFVVGFVVMACLRSFGWLPEIELPFGAGLEVSTLGLANQGAKACLAIAMAAIGLDTQFAAFRRQGLRPLLAGALATAAICLVTLIAIRSLPL